MPKNAQATVQLHSFHMLARLCSKSFKLGFNSTWTKKFQMYKLDLEKSEEQEIKLPISIGIIERVSEKNVYFCITDYVKAFNCVDHKKWWKFS